MSVNTSESQSETMEDRLANIGSRIDSLMTRVHDLRGDADEHVGHLMEDLHSTIEGELNRIERRIQSTSNHIDHDVSHARSEVLEATRDELAIWWGRLEGLRLQANLGKMEVNDRLQPLLQRLELAYERARGHLHELTRDELSWEDVEPQLMEAMRELKTEFDSAERQYRIA